MLKLIEEGCIAILRGDGERSLAQRGIDRGGIGDVAVGDPDGLGQNRGILAVVAEQAEEVSAQLAGVGRIAGRGRTELGVDGRKGAANPGRKSGSFFRGGCNLVDDGTEPR